VTPGAFRRDLGCISDLVKRGGEVRDEVWTSKAPIVVRCRNPLSKRR
jgi:hypothetical protein